jgi:hypothetical protein
MTGLHMDTPLQQSASDVAVRFDPATSITETAGFFGSPPERLFGSLVMPPGRAAAGVLICSSLYAELARNYRREVIVARELATHGIASFRFHYRGTGYSDGDPAALSFASMCEDAFTASAVLAERCPGLPTAFLGTRLGGLVAATRARSAPAAPLLLWDPLAGVGPFLVDAMKAGKAGGMVAGKQTPGAPAPETDVWAGGFMDSLGYRLPRGLRDSFEGVSLADCLGADARSVLVVSVVPRHDRSPRAKEVADVLGERTAVEVDLQMVEGKLSWWTERDWWEPDEEDPPTLDLIARSVEWLQARLAPEWTP